MTTDPLPCDTEVGRCAMRLLFRALDVGEQRITSLDLSGNCDRMKCIQQIETFFSSMSKYSLAFQYLEDLTLAHCDDPADREEVLPYLKEHLRQVRERGGLARLPFKQFPNIIHTWPSLSKILSKISATRIHSYYVVM